MSTHKKWTKIVESKFGHPAVRHIKTTAFGVPLRFSGREIGMLRT
jgi:hypothetical protein